MNNKLDLSDVDYLFSPLAVRETTAKIYKMALEGNTHFHIDESKIDACADYVLDVIYDNYSNLDIPFHSRWGHFEVGGIDRLKILNDALAEFDRDEKARRKIDLVITSVLLDAGAGTDWKYKEKNNTYNRSEGLAVASFHMFKEGFFANKVLFYCKDKLRVDAKALQKISIRGLKNAFQVSASNPIVGLEGRVQLLQNLGKIVESNTTIFPHQTPGSILDYLLAQHGRNIEVNDILQAVLKGLGAIWPGRIEVEGINLGDVWHYPPLGAEISKDSVICFHKLSQWLTYSLVSPLEEAGFSITGADKLTGLAEYRNGGLFIDFGVLTPKSEMLMILAHKPNSEFIVEWRALTIQLLDRVGARIQEKLSRSPADFPLAKVLEGGTWWAGRKIAKEKRADGTPPVMLDSDGTVF